MIITFCGHSKYVQKKGDLERALSVLEERIKGDAVTFYLGGYGSFDSFALMVARKYKGRHHNAKIIYVTPYMSEDYLRTHYDVAYYDGICYPPIENVPYKFAIVKRNEWMASQAHFIVAYVIGHHGGAYAMLLYAKRRKKEIFNLAEGEAERH